MTKSLIEKIKKKRSLLVKLLFAALAFILMVVFSCSYVSGLLSNHLAKDAADMLSNTKLNIESEFLTSQTALNLISQNAKELILEGDGKDVVLEYLRTVTQNMKDDRVMPSFTSGMVYGYFPALDNAFLNGIDWIPPDDFNPLERPWYTEAVKANGDIVMVQPYISADTNSLVITYAQSIYDDKNNFLGVVGLDVPLENISKYVIGLKLTKNGLASLTDANLNYVSNPNPELIGKNPRDVKTGLTPFVNDIMSNKDIFGRETVNYLGQKMLLFTSHLSNGWILTVSTPKGEYRQEMTHMVMVLIILGTVLAIALMIILIRIDAVRQKAEDENKKLNEEIQRNLQETIDNTRELQSAVIQIVADLVESRDGTTGGHIHRTQEYLRCMINELAKEDIYKYETAAWDIDCIIPTSQLHDVGKIAVSDLILNKPGKLTDEEFEIMKTHVTAGVDAIDRMEKLAGDSDFFKYSKIFAGTHHEKWDGRGYPKGLKGEEIPLEGRLMAIADVYDALVSERPYKPAFPHEKAVSIINEGEGTHFDPQIVHIFNKLCDKFAEISQDNDSFNNPVSKPGNTVTNTGNKLTPIPKTYSSVA